MNLMDIKVFVETDDDVRLARRIERDTTERNRTLKSVLAQYFKTVRPMHTEFVAATKNKVCTM
jgi:uridine kinase